MHRKWWQVGDHPIYGFETLAFYSVLCGVQRVADVTVCLRHLRNYDVLFPDCSLLVQKRV